MKRLIPILAVCLTFGCTGTTTTNNVKQAPTATVAGRYIEGGASRYAYVYNHKTNSDVIRFSYEYTKEQLDSVYGTCTRHEEDDDPCDGGFARWYDDKGIRLDFQFDNFNGRENKWLSAVYMIKGDYTLHITDSLEVKVGDNINDLDLSHHTYLKQTDRREHNDTVFVVYRVQPDCCDCPPLFVLRYINDTITFVRYEDVCV